MISARDNSVDKHRDQVLVNIHSICFIDLLGDSKTAKAWIALL